MADEKLLIADAPEHLASVPADFIMHFLVPVEKAPARHMESGTPADVEHLQRMLNQPIGHPGQAFAPACNPKLVMGPRHRGTGEAFALLGIANGVPFVGNWTCPKCIATEAWREAYLKQGGHPLAREEIKRVMDEGCCG